jgi:hypothetical protein
MAEINFIIRAFNEQDGQVIVEFEDCPPVAIDLVIDENGNIPEGELLYSAIRQFYPTWHFERKQKLSLGIKNADTIRPLIQPYSPTPPLSLEQISEEVRAERNEKLFRSDWTQLSDVSLTEQEKILWAEYRQKLRDITEQSGFPTNVNWPELP